MRIQETCRFRSLYRSWQEMAESEGNSKTRSCFKTRKGGARVSMLKDNLTRPEERWRWPGNRNKAIGRQDQGGESGRQEGGEIGSK